MGIKQSDTVGLMKTGNDARYCMNANFIRYSTTNNILYATMKKLCLREHIPACSCFFAVVTLILTP